MYVSPLSRFSTFGESHHTLNGCYQTWGSGVTGNVSDAVAQLRVRVEATTDAAVTEGQKSVQAAADAGANYLGQAKNLASSAISTAVVCHWYLRGVVEHALTLCVQSYLPTSITGGTVGNAAESAQGDPKSDNLSDNVPASSTELESGQHTVSNPYPASDVQARDIAVNESK
jgi:hypothetical protein